MDNIYRGLGILYKKSIWESERPESEWRGCSICGRDKNPYIEEGYVCYRDECQEASRDKKSKNKSKYDLYFKNNDAKIEGKDPKFIYYKNIDTGFFNIEIIGGRNSPVQEEMKIEDSDAITIFVHFDRKAFDKAFPDVKTIFSFSDEFRRKWDKFTYSGYFRIIGDDVKKDSIVDFVMDLEKEFKDKVKGKDEKMLKKSQWSGRKMLKKGDWENSRFWILKDGKVINIGERTHAEVAAELMGVDLNKIIDEGGDYYIYRLMYMDGAIRILENCFSVSRLNEENIKRMRKFISENRLSPKNGNIYIEEDSGHNYIGINVSDFILAEKRKEVIEMANSVREGVDRVGFKNYVNKFIKISQMWSGRGMVYCSKCGREPLPSNYFDSEEEAKGYRCYECKMMERGDEKGKTKSNEIFSKDFDFSSDEGHNRYYHKYIKEDGFDYHIIVDGEAYTPKGARDILELDDCDEIFVYLYDNKGMGYDIISGDINSDISNVSDEFKSKWDKYLNRYSIHDEFKLVRDDANKEKVIELLNDIVEEMDRQKKFRDDQFKVASYMGKISLGEWGVDRYWLLDNGEEVNVGKRYHSDVAAELLGLDFSKIMEEGREEEVYLSMLGRDAIRVYGNDFSVFKLSEKNIRRIQEFLRKRGDRFKGDDVIEIEDNTLGKFIMIAVKDFMLARNRKEVIEMSKNNIGAEAIERYMDRFMKISQMWGGEEMVNCSKCGKDPMPKKYYDDEYICWECQQKGEEVGTKAVGAKDRILKMFEDEFDTWKADPAASGVIRINNNDKVLSIIPEFGSSIESEKYWNWFYEDDDSQKSDDEMEKEILDQLNRAESVEILIKADKKTTSNFFKNKKYGKYYIYSAIDHISVPIDDNIIFDIIEDFKNL